MEPFIYKQKLDTPIFSLQAWEKEFPHLTVGFSAIKQSKCSTHYNYGLHATTQPRQVVENRERLTKTIGMPFSSWTSAEQVHGSSVRMVDRGDRGKGRSSLESAIPGADGLVTLEKDVLLATYYADCVPLYFYHKDLDVIGIAHAGWKGTVAQIGVKVLQEFIRLGAQVRDIWVAIGPAIGACCYEVDERVYTSFKSVISDEEIGIKKVRETKWILDLKEVNRWFLSKAGILKYHLFVSSWCTSCHPDLFYSYRRDKGNTGRMVAWIGKKEGSL